jgi:hypothetical protein
MQCTNCGAELQPGATVCPSCEQKVVPTKLSVAGSRKRAAAAPIPVATPSAPAATPESGQAATPPASPRIRHSADDERRPWQSPVLVLITVVVLVVTGWVLWAVLGTNTNTPQAAALRMMSAYGAYDAAGILDNVTHSSLTSAEIAAFEKQVTDGKASNQSRPWVKDVVITTSTVDPKDPNSATVQLTEQILDASKGTYSPRNETLALVKQNGKWLVRLF